MHTQQTGSSTSSVPQDGACPHHVQPVEKIAFQAMAAIHQIGAPLVAKPTAHAAHAAAASEAEPREVAPSMSSLQSASAGRASAASSLTTRKDLKFMWVRTQAKEVFTAALEAGVQHFVFDQAAQSMLSDWRKIASVPHVLLDAGEASATSAHCRGIVDEENRTVAVVQRVHDRASVERLAEEAQRPGGAPFAIMAATDWQSIPSENLVAAFQGSRVALMATAGTAEAAVVALQALEGGVQGVLLDTQDALQVKELAEWLSNHNREAAPPFQYEVATITRMQQAGMGHRVAVDLCENLSTGEGLLVGSFARALFLVHSECADSAYINSRPFRVNSGAVHAYTMGVGGRTAYLSELATGHTVTVADAAGRSRPVLVGRCKVETRPLTLVEATLDDGDVVSTLLQNAETVRLVGPASATTPGTADADQAWEATSVSQLQEGARVYILRQDAARHTGIAITETKLSDDQVTMTARA
eukprot:CAMPEP_0206136136 /NCGR_PEP_ID=MMETSP1473-20131121/1362_1 /ASSEMBLY_ACC=CAM_ASM_001109 /TAXON_ID=1461547 /ORGANISM="Stichococcus sp, Strain RCC1054" /LENGTH=472 /DNA_ID=CAMNT_0053528439 /DNA_START=282 /DNA_END=1702 /DNA_ORIENTATION=+